MPAMAKASALLLALLAVSSTASRAALRATAIVEPPEPVGEAPEKSDDGAFKSKADACAACKFYATGSCAMYNTCRCYAANAAFPMIATPKPDNWVWACGGDDVKYKLCFGSSTDSTDNFGDAIDTD